MFGHCWFEKESRFSSSSWTQNHKDYIADNDTIGKLWKYYSFDKFVVEKPKQFKFHNENIREKYKQINHHIGFNEIRENNILSHLYSIESVMNIVPDNLDYYVLCRYDTIITDIPDMTQLNSEKLYLSNCGVFPDILMIFSKKYLTWLKNLYTMTQEMQFSVNGFFPEVFKEATFFHHGYSMSDVIHTPMFGHIVRDE
jgi:hypothetical protein